MKKIPDAILKEIIFGMEDGMVSTLGALTGVAIGSQNMDYILLTGTVIIAVESISMGVGSFLSGQSIRERQLMEIELERNLVHKETEAEILELEEMLQRDGWSKKLAKQMSKEAGENKDLLFREMQYRELELQLKNLHNNNHGAWGMFVAYIIGGFIPLSAYLIFRLPEAIWWSITFSLIGLFLLGIAVSDRPGITRLKRAIRMMLFGGLAILIGVLAGMFFRV
ncbi:MAG: VIT1/CCC1 transporter family protein [Patescibacteria group bacterium]